MKKPEQAINDGQGGVDFQMKTVLITGAGGYIGRHVVRHVLDMGCRVIAADLRLDGVDPRAERCQTSIFNGEADLYQRLGAPDVCIHLAWRDGFVHQSDAHMQDLSGHITFLQNMMKSGLKTLSVMGTMHEVGYWEGAIDENTPCKPLSQYGVAKNALRQSLLLSSEKTGCHVRWLRAYYITGDDLHSNSIFAKISQAAAEGKPSFPFTTGKNQYDFIDVEELAEMIAVASLQEEEDGIINVCTGKPMTLAERVEGFIREHHYNIRLEYGVYPERQYDSPGIWGDATRIERIMSRYEESKRSN